MRLSRWTLSGLSDDNAIMTPVIMSGGSGTRLWPLSRSQFPKQFCELFGQSLQARTLDRVKPLGSPVIVTSAELRTLTEAQLHATGAAEIEVLYEPIARNTAPAIAYFCRWAEMRGRSDEIVGFFPSDHLIRDEETFLSAVREAEKKAGSGHVVTLGVRPDRPETGFGYIQSDASGTVQKFHEKPDLPTAEGFLRDGRFSWNAGIFIFRVRTMIGLFQSHQPQLWQGLAELKTDLSNLAEVYPRLPSISIDYAIMEKIGGGEGLLQCIPVDMGWSDVGSWDAVAEEFLSRGEPANAGVKVREIEGRGNFVFSTRDKSVNFVGVDDLRVVDTGDALLIARAGQSQKVRQVVEQLAKENSPLLKSHAFEQRPWGHFEVLRDTPRFKSKIIQVRPREQLSYQSHSQREEHWIITGGRGEIVLDDRVIAVSAGHYVHIPLGAKHRIRNTGTEPLEFVEVQLGTYFGEDDIVRYQDDYRRV